MSKPAVDFLYIKWYHNGKGDEIDMKKKLLAILLVVTTMFSLCSCSAVTDKLLNSDFLEGLLENIEIPGMTESELSAMEGDCTPLLYKVTDGKGGTLYLLGSIHIGDGRMLNMADYVINAYNESDYLAVEADIIAFEKNFVKQIVCAQMLLCEEGTTIQDHLGDELFEKTKAFLEENGLYDKTYMSYGPAMWSSLVDSAIIEMTELNTAGGADRFFLKEAKKEGKEIREVESAEFQYLMLKSFSDELYRFMIESSIDGAEASAEGTKALYEAWLRGDEAELEALMQDDLTGATEEEIALYEEYTEKMLTDRNEGMLDKAEDYMEDGNTGFYVVGAAHIVGEGGLAELLEEKGYTVTVVE